MISLKHGWGWEKEVHDILNNKELCEKVELLVYMFESNEDTRTISHSAKNEASSSHQVWNKVWYKKAPLVFVTLEDIPELFAESINNKNTSPKSKVVAN